MRPRILRAQLPDGASIDLTGVPVDRVLVLVTRSGRGQAALASALRDAQAGDGAGEIVALEGGSPDELVAELLSIGPPPVAAPLAQPAIRMAVEAVATAASGSADLLSRRQILRERLDEVARAAPDGERLTRRCAEITSQVEAARGELEESRQRLAELVASRRELELAKAQARLGEIQQAQAEMAAHTRQREQLEAELSSALATVEQSEPTPRFEAADLESAERSLESRRKLLDQIDALAAEAGRDTGSRRALIEEDAGSTSEVAIPEEVLGDLLEAGGDLHAARESTVVLERAIDRERERVFGANSEELGDEHESRASQIAAAPKEQRRELRGRLALLEERRASVIRAREATGSARVELGALEGGRDRDERDETRRSRALTIVAGAAGAATLITSGAWALLPGGIALASLGAGLLGRRRGIPADHGARLEARSRLDACEAELQAAERLEAEAVSRMQTLCQQAGFKTMDELQSALLDHARLRALIELENRRGQALARVVELEQRVAQTLHMHGLLDVDAGATGHSARSIEAAIERVRAHLERRRRLRRLDRQLAEREAVQAEAQARLARVEADLIEVESRLEAAGMAPGASDLSLTDRLRQWLAEHERVAELKEKRIPLIESRLASLPSMEELENSSARLEVAAQRVAAEIDERGGATSTAAVSVVEVKAIEERLIENRIRQEELAVTLRMRMRELDSRLIPSLHAVQGETDETHRRAEQVRAWTAELATVEESIEAAMETWLTPVLALLQSWTARANLDTLPAPGRLWLERRLEDLEIGRGELDLIALLARVALASELFDQGTGVVVLEDSLALLDDTVFAAALRMLAAEVTDSHQVVLLTSQATRLDRNADSIHPVVL